jgi:glycosyltransferase involved in cell wall biosynthesis
MKVLNRMCEAFGNSVELMVFGSDVTDERKLSLDTRVVDLGRISPERVAVLMRNVDIFLDFSVWQAMGLTAMEAMASGCAVVVPINGGTDDFCIDHHNALIVDSRDENAFFAAASKLVTDNRLLARLRQNATEDICSYSQERSARRILDALFEPST